MILIYTRKADRLVETKMRKTIGLSRCLRSAGKALTVTTAEKGANRDYRNSAILRFIRLYPTFLVPGLVHCQDVFDGSDRLKVMAGGQDIPSTFAQDAQVFADFLPDFFNRSEG
jgi:hypothetical protein